MTKILVFDTETTGLPIKDASIYETTLYPYIIQLSYILYDTSLNYSIIINNYIKLDNDVEITPESYKIHNISKEMLNEKGISINVALQEFNNYLKNADIVVGHNLTFDKKMIFVECFRNKIKQYFTCFINNQKITKEEYCTMKNTKKLCNIMKIGKNNKFYLKVPSLLELYKFVFPNMEIPQNMHNSLIDVIMTLMCYLKIKYDINVLDINPILLNYFNSFI